MRTNLIVSLHREEHAILEELRASRSFRRLEEIRRLLALYDVEAPIGADLDAMLSAGGAPAAASNDILRGIGAAMREARIA